MNTQGKIFIVTLLVVAALCAKAQTKTTGWVAPANVAALKNPLEPTPDVIAEGKKNYINTCAPCHGNKGKGDGIASIACDPRPADHTSQKVQQETDGSLFWKITTGHGQMISYKSIMSDEQRWKLVLYIRTLATKK